MACPLNDEHASIVETDRLQGRSSWTVDAIGRMRWSALSKIDRWAGELGGSTWGTDEILRKFITDRR
jgi:hypothetical protein